MTKRIAGNLLKYLLAVGLLALVLWLNWGYAARVAGRVVVSGADSTQASAEAPTTSGTIVACTPGEPLVLRQANGEEVRLVVVESGGVSWPQGIVKQTEVELPTGEARLRAGRTVAVWEAPRGLAYVWQKHLVEGEPVQWHYFLLALLCFAFALTITIIRWYFLVRALDLPFSLFDAFRLGLVGAFFNAFLPGSVGGDIIKAAFIAREQPSRRAAAIATVILDRAIALWGLICFVAMLGSTFWIAGSLDLAATRGIVVGALALVGASVLLCLFLAVLPEWRAERFAGRLTRLPKVGHALSEFWRAVWMYRCRKGSVLFCLAFSWIGHIGFVFMFYFAALTLWNPDDPAQKIPTLAQHFLIVPIGMVIQAMPLFPGGAGIGEAGFGGLYKLLGCSAANGVLGSLVQRVGTWIIGLLGYFVYLRMKPTLQAITTPVAHLNGHAGPSAERLGSLREPTGIRAP